MRMCEGEASVWYDWMADANAHARGNYVPPSVLSVVYMGDFHFRLVSWSCCIDVLPNSPRV